MSKDIFDADLHRYLDGEKEFECTECGKPIDKEGVCGKVCHDASML